MADHAAELLERVEQGNGADRELDVALECLLSYKSYATRHRPSTVRGKVVCNYPNGRAGTYNAPDYTASIDGALALVERVRPGVLMDMLGGMGRDRSEWQVRLDGGGWGMNRTLARAILAALLRSLPSEPS